MSLAPGMRLGPYDIVALLGAGGMGQVYRAKDSRLKREVALKVLPADVAADPERLARFQREAEVLASLNHPNIAQVYGIEANALVMDWSMARTSRSAWRVDRSRSTTRCRSRSRSPKRSNRLTTLVSCIAI